MTFALDPRLAGDTRHIGDLDLCRLLLMNDKTYPWCVLVPRMPDLADIVDLARPDRLRLMDEIATVSEALRAVCRPTKLNVASLGNVVRQLHVHVIARYDHDPAWPGPIWGKAPPRPYDPPEAEDFSARLASAIGPALKVDRASP